MQCPRCQHENPADQKFCGDCGTPLKATSAGGLPGPSYVDLERELIEAVRQQTATSEILRVISRSPTHLQPVLNAVVENASRLCGAANVSLYQVDGQLMRKVAERETGPQLTALRVGETRPITRTSVSGRAIIDRAVVHIHDHQAPDVALQFPDGARRDSGIRTTIGFPLLREREAIGAFTVYRTDDRPFSEREIALLETFADQAVIAIENVRLFKELEAKNRDLGEALDQQTATSEILRVISSSPGNIQPVFDAIARHAARLCDAVNGLVIRFDGQLLHLAAHHNVDPQRLDAVRQAYPRPPSRGALSGRAILTRDVVHVPDVSKDPEYTLPAATTIGYRSVLAVPMVHEGVAHGTILVARDIVAPFSDTHIALLRTFADQAVIAVENVRLFTELQEKNRALSEAHAQVTEALEQQTATSEILRTISQTQTDVQPVFETIVQSAARLCRAARSAIFLTDGTTVDQRAGYGASPEARSATRANYPRAVGMDSMPGAAILTRSIVHLPDTEEPSAVEFAALARQVGRVLGFRSVLAVPMLREGEPVGAITAARLEPGGFSVGEVELLKTLADQAVIAVENARLLTELQARTEELGRSVGELRALSEVGQAISSTLDLETVLTTIVSRAVQLSAADGGVVFEYDEGTEEFVQRAGTDSGGALAEARRSTRIRKGEGVLGRTAITLEPIQVPDITIPGAYAGRLREMLVESGIRAILAVPMVYEGRLLGCLVVSRNRPGEFPAGTIELLRTFATQSALAIQNARLFHEIADKSRQLEAASRHKSEFLASMSHELRTPLNGILGFNEMILGEIYGEVPPDLREPLTEMQVSGRHLLRLINNVLDLSKIEAGRMELALGDYVVPDVVEQVRASLRPLAADKGLEFVTVVPADLPLAHGDAGRITQCLTNLAGNALKFTREGRVEIVVELQGETLMYRVSDTGIGIAPDRIETLFTEFRQADPTIASEFGGSGLGLSITRKFAEMHGGRVWVESEPGRGSRFFLALPLRVEGGAPK